jgi:protein involved in polysaccharide export with SLBB domain
MRVRRLLWSLVVVGMACSSQQPRTLPDPTPTSELTLERGDVVRVAVWREPDLSGDFAVDDQGRLTLPLLGSVPVINRPWQALQDSLLGAYAGQLRNPSVTLVPLRRISVLGEVMRPSQYLVDPTTSLAGVVAMAGGATAMGNLHRVRVIRNGQTIVDRASIEGLLLQSGVHSNDQIFVDRRSWIELNVALVASATLSAASIIVALLR